MTGQPTKAVVLNPADELVALTAKLPGGTQVVDIDGEPYEIRTSPLVPAGQVVVVDLTTLGLATVP